MAKSLNPRPEGLAGFAARVYDILAQYTVFPWPVMKTQCERVGVDPMKLLPSQLDEQLIRHLADGVGRFTRPEKRAHLFEELQKISEPHRSKSLVPQSNKV